MDLHEIGDKNGRRRASSRKTMTKINREDMPRNNRSDPEATTLARQQCDGVAKAEARVRAEDGWSVQQHADELVESEVDK